MFRLFYNDKKRNERYNQIIEQQSVLLDTAISTADLATQLASELKNQLDDHIHQLELTSTIMSEALIVCDSNGKIISFNPAAQKMFKYTIEQIDNISGKELFSKDGFNKLYEKLSNRIAIKGKKSTGELFPIEAAMVELEKSSGSKFTMVLARDQKEFDNECYLSLFELNFDAVLVVQNDTIVAANPATLSVFGTNIETIMTKPFKSLIEIDLSKNSLGVVKAGGIHNDGTSIQLVISSVPIKWNRKPAYLIIARNVSNR